MKQQLIYYFIAFLLASPVADLMAQEQTHILSPHGGGKSEGGSYTNYSAVGGEVVNGNISGGSYQGKAGFFYSTFAKTTTNRVEDSLALVAIFEALDGGNWSNTTGWLTGNLNTWVGVDLDADSDRVIGLSLADNNLTGRVPSDINRLTAIRSIELQGNNIEFIPDMTTLQELVQLDVSRNKLEFGVLEANAGITGINYQDQDSIGATNYIEIAVGTDTVLELSTTGSSNSYQWFRNGQPIEGANGSRYSILSINKAAMGDYHAIVTNTIVPDLTLTGRVSTVNAVASLNGQVRLSTGNVLPEGEVKLLRVAPGNFEATYIVEVDAEGFYEFDSVVLDNYLLVAIADTATFPDQFPTYYTRSIFWEEADTLTIIENIAAINIDLEAVTEIEMNGSGTIEGYLEEEEPEDGRLLKMKRVAGAGVSVRRARRAGRINRYPHSRLMEDYELVAFTYTNELGEFYFENLEPDTYRINIQYPGYPMDEESNLDIMVGDKKSGAENRTLAAKVQDGKITVTENIVTGVNDNPLLQISVFPNPAKAFVNVVVPDGDLDSYLLILWDSKGTMMKVDQEKNGAKIVLDMSPLPRGIYVLNIYNTTSNEVVKSYKVILSQ